MVRLPREADRNRFVDLFCNEDFMVFYPGVLTTEEAQDRFDHMVAVCQAVSFGKQPVVELSSGRVVGYTGVDYIDFEGKTWLEWGYRLVPECRGLGYATEASEALLAKAHQTYAGELLAIIAPENLASQNVCHKLGFTFWKQAPVQGDIRNLYTFLSENPPYRPGQPDHREQRAVYNGSGEQPSATDVGYRTGVAISHKLGEGGEHSPVQGFAAYSAFTTSA
nr:GNAT family N-acetyltransferase [Phytoactinopolyspora alkaliphila]